MSVVIDNAHSPKVSLDAVFESMPLSTDSWVRSITTVSGTVTVNDNVVSKVPNLRLEIYGA
jgi:hypothetical protein